MLANDNQVNVQGDGDNPEFDHWEWVSYWYPIGQVVSFKRGTDAGFGENYFPDNVLGPPDPSPGLNEYNASNKPQEGTR